MTRNDPHPHHAVAAWITPSGGPWKALKRNWRDHIEVITKRRAKIRLNSVSKEHLDPFEALTSARRIIPLDAKHKATIQSLQESGFSTLWVADHHLLQTHTCALASLIDDPKTRNELGIIGYFKTTSQGKDKGTPNCFLFPLNHGGWRVYRFSPGIAEAETWTQDGNGWTVCYFNRLPDFDTACKAHGGLKDPDSRAEYVFATAQKAVAAAGALGQKIEVGDSLKTHLESREASLKVSKDGKLAVYIKRDKKEDPERIDGWLQKKDRWAREYEKHIDTDPGDELGFNDFDNALRSLVTAGNDFAGWVARLDGGASSGAGSGAGSEAGSEAGSGASSRASSEAGSGTNNEWVHQPGGNVKMLLQHIGMGKPEAEAIMGGAIKRSWKMVNLPFQDEYPGGRQWNLDAAQFRYQPVRLENELADDEAPHHPHWDLIFQHIGSDLNAAIKESTQMQRLNIRNGAQYLVNWIACLLRDPFEPLPYLFLYGSENCGKSIFHEAVALLVTKGVIKADRCLTSVNDFNGELANAILCVVEEKNVAASATAHARIKEWVTCLSLSIRKMRTDSYEQPNTTHWVQCANRQDHCPVFPGDSTALGRRVSFSGAVAALWSALETTKPSRSRLRPVVVHPLPAPRCRPRPCRWPLRHGP